MSGSYPQDRYVLTRDCGVDPEESLSSSLEKIETNALSSGPWVFGHYKWREEESSWLKFCRESQYLPPLVSVAEEEFRHSGWRLRREKVYLALQMCGVPAARLDRFKNCGSLCFVERSPSTQRVRVRGSFCHDRFCLACASGRSALIARNLAAMVKGKDIKHMVFTIQHSPVPLAEQLTLLLRWFKALRQTKEWKRNVRGGAYFVEVKRSKDGKFWHPHIHVIVECCWYDRDLLCAQWVEITKTSFMVWISKPVGEKEVLNYVCKYASKPFDASVFKTPDALCECIDALRGRRLLECFGQWRGKELESRSDDPGDWQVVGRLESILNDAAGGNLGAIALIESLWRARDDARGSTDAGLSGGSGG